MSLALYFGPMLFKIVIFKGAGGPHMVISTIRGPRFVHANLVLGLLFGPLWHAKNTTTKHAFQNAVFKGSPY